MTDHAELTQRCTMLREALSAAEARLADVVSPPEPQLSALEREVEALLARTEQLEAELDEGRRLLTSLREDLSRLQAPGSLTG